MKTTPARCIPLFCGLSLGLGPPSPGVAQSPPSPVSFTAGSWRFTLGGYVKLDLIHDFDPIGSTDEFDPRTIPVDGRPGTNTRAHARETRLSLGLVRPAGGRDLSLTVEGDFFGSGNAFRLRHAYGRYGLILAGQTWTTFMDEENIPETIDYETPLAAAFVRQAMVRLIPIQTSRTELAFGVEESDPEILLPDGVTGNVEKNLPDFTGRIRLSRSRGHVQLSGFLGRTRFRPDTGEPQDLTNGGFQLSARLRTFGRDALYGEFAYGPGLGRYRGSATASFNAAGELKAVKVAGLTAGYERYWSSRWSSNVVVSPAWVVSRLGDPAITNDRFDYFAINTRYWFLEQRAWAGLEYLYGRRRLRSGLDQAANRLQFAVRFDILE